MASNQKSENSNIFISYKGSNPDAKTPNQSPTLLQTVNDLKKVLWELDSAAQQAKIVEITVKKGQKEKTKKIVDLKNNQFSSTTTIQVNIQDPPELSEFINQMNHSRVLVIAMQYLNRLYPHAVVIACHPTQSSDPAMNDLNLYDPQTGYYICVEVSFKQTGQSHKQKIESDLLSLYRSNPAQYSSDRTPLSQKRCFLAVSEESLKWLAKIVKPSYVVYSGNGCFYSIEAQKKEEILYIQKAAHVVDVTNGLESYRQKQLKKWQ